VGQAILPAAGFSRRIADWEESRLPERAA